ncbi:MAG: hypothetical protein VKN33_03435 [Candidatus Sericytochromatia bacterium]|nr:hypothetical protein [Candidatus Sericytochromatia bacterium]
MSRIIFVMCFMAAASLTGACGRAPQPVSTALRTPAGMQSMAQPAGEPALVGIAFDGQMAETFAGESMRPMTFEPVTSGVPAEKLSYRWNSESTFLGYPNQRLFHFLPASAGTYHIVCRAFTRDGQLIGMREATVWVRKAPRPPL